MSRRPFSFSGQYSTPTAEGLSELILPKNATIDVVFIHGFTGDPVDTWTHKTAIADIGPIENVAGNSQRPAKTPRNSSGPDASKGLAHPQNMYWPRDLLPQTLPKARILVYGYKSKIQCLWQKASGPDETVLELALEFLKRLEGLRRSKPSRPLVIVAHSLGGLIAKEALRQARTGENLDPQFDCRSLYDSTAAILFFGTPHRGANPLRWRKNLIDPCAQALGFSTNKEIVDFLSPSSKQLIDLRNQFPSIIREGGWIIYSFQEKLGPSLLNGRKIVEEHSSCFGDSSLEKIVQIDADHVGMCKFKGFDDSEYQKVAIAFNDIQQRIETRSTTGWLPSLDATHIAPKTKRKFSQVSSSLEEDIYQPLRDSLQYPTIDIHYHSIPDALKGTCEWLVQTPEFRQWSSLVQGQRQKNYLCIKGKPGSGKSTLMKSTAIEQKKRTDVVVISFFFNARSKEDLEKSTTGLYRSLLLQILENVPNLRLDTRGSRLDIFQKSEDYDWTIGELQSLFKIVVEALGQRRVMCFIDALDECKAQREQIPDLIIFLSRIIQNTVSSQGHFLFCLSSRHVPFLSIENSFEIDLANIDQHRKDITKYINRSLRIGSGDRIEKIKEKLLNKSSGIFLWVYLVVLILNDESGEGNVDSLEKHLNDIPEKLEALFQDILTRNAKDKEKFILCLQWMIYAARPLKAKELYFGIRSGIDLEALRSLHLADVTPEVVNKFVLHCSKGFVEMTKNREPKAQFIHESVREYFLEKGGFDAVNSELSPGLSHDRLGGCCENYMRINGSRHLPDYVLLQNSSETTTKLVRGSIPSRYPFLEYSVQRLLYHKDMADGLEVSQKKFVNRFDLAEWIKLNNAVQKCRKNRYTSTASLSYILADNNLSSLMRTHLCRLGDSPESNELRLGCERYLSPLHAALFHSSWNESILLALLNPNRRSDSSCNEILAKIKANLPGKTDLQNWPGRRLIHWAVTKGQAEVLDWLLSQVKVDPLSQDNSSLTPLHYAVKLKDEWAIEALLSSIVSLDLEALNRSVSPAENKWEDTLDHFISKHIDLDLKIFKGRTLLSYAILEGYAYLKDALLLRKAHPLIQDCDGRTPLSYAAGRGDDRTVNSMLLGIDGLAFTQDVDDSHRSPLSYAAEGGHEKVVRLLLTKGFAFDSRDSSGCKPILYAAKRGHDGVVDLLRSEGADMIFFATWLKEEIETRTNDERSLRLLLKHEHCLNGTPLDLSNAFSNAINNRCPRMVDLILSKGVDPDVLRIGLNSRIPLLMAVGKDDVNVIDVLLSRGANPNATGEGGRTPLMLACIRKWYNVAELLLSGGANINLRDEIGCTALQYAVNHGAKEIRSRLVSLGAVK